MKRALPCISPSPGYYSYLPSHPSSCPVTACQDPFLHLPLWDFSSPRTAGNSRYLPFYLLHSSPMLLSVGIHTDTQITPNAHGPNLAASSPPKGFVHRLFLDAKRNKCFSCRIIHFRGERRWRDVQMEKWWCAFLVDFASCFLLRLQWETEHWRVRISTTRMIPTKTQSKYLQGLNGKSQFLRPSEL